MKTPQIRFSILILIIFVSGKAFAQQEKDFSAEENNLAKLYRKLADAYHGNDDTVQVYLDMFEKALTTVIQNPASLNYPFRKLIDSNFCRIVTSADGNFRIYSWDTQTGGTMDFFHEIHQWKSAGKVFFNALQYEEGDAGTFCSKIFSVNINGKKCYLAVENAILSSRDEAQFISAYRIDGNKLNDTVKVFNTRTQKLNGIHIEFDFFSVVDRPERPLELISYDDVNKIVYIPAVDQKEQVTDKFMLYQLKGGYFEFIGFGKERKAAYSYPDIIDQQRKMKATVFKRDSSFSVAGNIHYDYRIFGYKRPDTNSIRLIVFSVFTRDVENNPYHCLYGAYYQTSSMENMEIKYKGSVKSFIQAELYISGSKVADLYFEKRWVELVD